MNHHEPQPVHHYMIGFTIIELIIAISIAALMMWFINTLFNDTQRVISLGMSTGDALVASESIGIQMERDADLMLGPSNNGGNGGFLIIINKRYGNTTLPDPNVGSAADLTGQITRSDQLIFIAGGTGGDKPYHSLTPKNDHEFISDIAAQRARIWYGHLQMTNPNGSTPNTFTPGDNTRADHWVLGRQALLFADPADVGGNDFYVSAPKPDEWVSHCPLRTSPNTWRLFSGMTDVVRAAYDNTLLTTNGIVTLPTQPEDYLEWTYAKTSVSAPYNYRLRCNADPSLDPDFSNTSSSVDAYASWRLAQTHAYLARNVSDFIVEFAADIQDDPNIGVPGQPDGEPDRYPVGTPNAGDLIWYSAYNLPDTQAINGDTDSISKQVPPSGPDNDFWTISSGSPAYEPFYSSGVSSGFPDPVINSYNHWTGNYENAEAAFIFRFDDNDPVTCKWPYLIRIRYRMHDDAGLMRNAEAVNLNFDGADNNGNGTPDDGTEYSDSKPSPGRWFEHILRVNRP